MSAKNSKPNSKPSSVHRQKRKDSNVCQINNIMTIDNTRSSVYQKAHTSGERLSDA